MTPTFLDWVTQQWSFCLQEKESIGEIGCCYGEVLEERKNFSFGHVEIKMLVGQSNALVQPPDQKFRLLLNISYH